MRRKRAFSILTALALLLLCACGTAEPLPEATSEPTPEPTPISTPEPTTEPTPELTPEPTAVPEHSTYYLPGYGFEEVFEAFREVTLSSEYPTEDYVPVLHRWASPIYYYLTGEYTEADGELIDLFFGLLSYLPGFPGAAKAPDEDHANMLLRFCGEEEFFERISDFLTENEMEGAVEYWYAPETNELVRAEVFYRSDALTGPEQRTSVLLEEIINGIGATNDTLYREDSILYQYGSEVTFPSDMDWTIIQMIYDPALRPGMDEEACKEALRGVYW